MTDSPFTQHTPGRYLAARPLPLCAGEVAEIQRTPLEAVKWSAVAALALVVFAIAAVGAVGFLAVLAALPNHVA